MYYVVYNMMYWTSRSEFEDQDQLAGAVVGSPEAKKKGRPKGKAKAKSKAKGGGEGAESGAAPPTDDKKKKNKKYRRIDLLFLVNWFHMLVCLRS